MGIVGDRWNHGSDRRDIDDAAAATLVLHLADRFSHAQEGAARVHRMHMIPGFD